MTDGLQFFLCYLLQKHYRLFKFLFFENFEFFIEIRRSRSKKLLSKFEVQIANIKVCMVIMIPFVWESVVVVLIKNGVHVTTTTAHKTH